MVGVRAGGDVLEPLGEDGFGIDRRGRGAVAGVLGGLAGNFLDHLGAHVLVGILEFDLLGDGDAVLGDGGGTERFLEDDDAARGAEGRLHGLGEFLNAAEHPLPGIDVVRDLFGSHGVLPSSIRDSEGRSSIRIGDSVGDPGDRVIVTGLPHGRHVAGVDPGGSAWS